MTRESIGKHVNALSKFITYYINQRAKKFNLNMTQVEILKELYDLKEHNNIEGISQNELGDRLHLDKITVTKQLNVLSNEGYVIRKVNEDDNRIKEVYVTEKGHEIKEDIKEVLKNVTEILSRDFSEEENKMIIDLLKRMSENIYQKV